MSDPYAFARARTADVLRRFNTGTITLSRTTHDEPDAEAPWSEGDVSATAVYTLDARADGTAGEYADGTTVLATDRLLIVSPLATLASAVVEIAPLMTDTLQIDGETKVIKKIDAVPAAGPAVRFHLFISS